MNIARPPITGLTVLLMTLLGLPTMAQAADITTCHAIEDRLERYSCYDAVESAAAESVAPSPAETAEPAPPAGVDSFGIKSSKPSARTVEGTDGQTELVDTISALDEREYQKWVITLTSGQRWRQITGSRYNLRVGDEVRIYPSHWGNSYRLSVKRLSGFIPVERVH